MVMVLEFKTTCLDVIINSLWKNNACKLAKVSLGNFFLISGVTQSGLLPYACLPPTTPFYRDLLTNQFGSGICDRQTVRAWCSWQAGPLRPLIPKVWSLRRESILKVSNFTIWGVLIKDLSHLLNWTVSFSDLAALLLTQCDTPFAITTKL